MACNRTRSAGIATSQRPRAFYLRCLPITVCLHTGGASAPWPLQALGGAAVNMAFTVNQQRQQAAGGGAAACCLWCHVPMLCCVCQLHFHATPDISCSMLLQSGDTRCQFPRFHDNHPSQHISRPRAHAAKEQWRRVGAQCKQVTHCVRVIMSVRMLVCYGYALHL